MDSVSTNLPVLIGQAGPLNGQRWLIDRPLLLGRDASCDIVIPDRQVSRYHARMTPDADGVLLEDLGSKNGTFCKAQRIEEPVFLSDGDLLQVALVQNFVFLSSDSTMPMDSGFTPNRKRTGKLFLDGRSRRVWIGQQEMIPPLSASQFRFLQALYDQQGKVVSRTELINVVWGSEEAEGVSEQALDAMVRRLRDRLLSLDANHNYVITVRGHGLRLDNPPE